MDQVEEIKQKTDIAAVVGGYVDLKRAGRNLKGRCPFHEEKTPSFMVNEELGIFKCFGCGKGGDAIKFLMDIEGLEFPEALEKLADRVGVKLVRRDGTQEKSEKTKLYEVNSLAAEYYHYLLTGHSAGEEARKYLKERGIGDKIIKTFKLGYALDEWDGLLTYLTKKKNYSKDILVKAGLVIESTKGGYDRFRGRVMIPLLDSSGRVVGFSGRVLGKSEEAKYINSPETEIYHKSRMLFGLTIARQEVRKNDRVVVVEGDFDMISSYTAGVTETVAIKGSALTGEMLTILSKLTRNIVLALDADKAGEAAMKRSIEEAERHGMSIKIVDIVGGKDPDEVARKSPKNWREQVEKAVEIYEFVINKALKRWGNKGPEAVRRVSEEVLPYLAKIGNSVVQAYWVGKIAKILEVDEQKVWEQMNKSIKFKEVGQEQGEKNEKETRSRLEMLGYQLIAMLFVAKQPWIEAARQTLLGLALEGAWGKIIVAILAKGEINKAVEFINQLPEELKEAAREAYLLEVNEELTEKDIKKTAEELVTAAIKSERARLSEEIRQKEKEGDKEEISRLSKRYVELSLRAR